MEFGGAGNPPSLLMLRLEPISKEVEITAILKEIYGGEWSWDKRSVLILIGDKCFAASIHGYPHQGDRIPRNGMNGHICAHFLGSKIHANNKEDPKHQEAVQYASSVSVDDVQILVNEFYENLTNIE